MRKHLLRIVFNQVWRFESAGNELFVGYGWAISLFVVIAAISLGLLWKITRERGQVLSSAFFWAIIPIALLIIPVLKLPVAQSGIPLFGYGVMLAVGFFSATFLASQRAKKTGLNAEVIWDLITWILIPGIVGARIVYLLQNGSRVFEGKQGPEIIKAAIALWDGGIVFYGCIIGGVLGILAYCRKNQIRPLQLLDIIMPSLFVGLGFGRIGCFLYGCCFGAVCSMPWAVQFPHDSLTFERLAHRSFETGDKLLEADAEQTTTKELIAAGRIKRVDRRIITPPDEGLTTIPLHPAQIYSSVLAFSLAGILAWFFWRRPYEGSVMALGWILYPINRFVLEIIRDDEPGRMGTGLTFSQLMSIGLFISGCGIMVWLQKKHTAEKTNLDSENS